MAETIENDGAGDCKPYSFSSIPYRVGTHLEFLDFFDDGSLIFGSSNLVIRNWDGAIWYFKDADSAPDKHKATSGHSCEAAISCGKFLSNDTVIFGDDYGTLHNHVLTKFEDGSIHFVSQMNCTQHDSWITGMSLTLSKTKTVSSGSDLLINVLDNGTMESDVRYPVAHSQLITSVECGLEEDIFASTSLDRTALLWDYRQVKPALGIYENEFVGLTSLSWKNVNEVAIGSNSGQIFFVDVRTLNLLSEVQLEKKTVHKLVYKDGFLAVCFDSNVIYVIDSNNEVEFKSTQHTGLVRDLAWHPLSNKLYSCGFDTNIFSHSIFES